MHRAVPPIPGGDSWKKSSYCNGGDCVQVAQAGDSILFGDSKNPDGPVLTFTLAEWNAVITSIKGDHTR
jgi:hypothetical protein